MNSILKKLQEPKNFDAYINEYMKTSTYQALWKNEISQIDYTAAKQYQQSLAEYNAALVGSVISKNGEKPVHQMPNIGELVGSIGHMGDQWELDADYLDQLAYLEGRYRDRAANYTQEQQINEYDKIITYSFRPFEKAVIAPHKRLDMLYYEGLFKGTQTVSRANNLKANTSYTFNLEVYNTGVSTAAWGNSSSVPITDLQTMLDYIESKGRDCRAIRMSKATFRKMCKSSQIASTFKLDLGRTKVDATVPVLSPEQVNVYLNSIGLPAITIEPNRFATLADGTSINMTAEDRVVFQCAENVAVMKIADSLERVYPLDGKTYSEHDDNLVGFWQDKTGYHVDYDMWAQPVFNGINDYFILKTDTVNV